ncbi:MAG TPA: FMN-dependent NADH-azoreductase [bacterium]|jgi:FMN-dependent NADH-azoreductase|nr:FMN-dependent NADH-azoreductase [bacterium]
MRQILVVDASPRGSESASREIAQKLSVRLRERFPDAKLVHRDLVSETLPPLNSKTIKAIFSKDPALEGSKDSLRLSNELTDELLASDLLVISTPMWNFGIPPYLKLWIDLVVRPGRTFKYTENGAQGLAENKKAVLVLASGGVFSEGPWKVWDHVEPYLRTIMTFIGIRDVQTVRVEGMNIPQLKELAVPNAEKSLEKLIL